MSYVINETVNATRVIITSPNKFELNQTIFSMQLASNLILAFILFIFLIWLYIIILGKVHGKKIWKYIFPLFFLLIMVALWVFVNLQFGMELWGAFN